MPKLSYCITCEELVKNGEKERATRANYGLSGSGKKLYCFSHKRETDVSIGKEKAKKCLYEGCDKVASYGMRESKVREYCVTHKPDNYVDKRKKMCNGDNDTCMIQASYASIGSKKPVTCTIHKLEGYVDVVTQGICSYEGCYKQGSFGDISQPKIRYCKEHKSENHVDVGHDKCKHEGCSKRARFASRGQKKPVMCYDHRLDDMVDIDSVRCKHPNCYVQPSYGEPGTKKWLYCVTHKKEHHVDIRSRKCKHEDCGKQPVFGEKEGEPLFCKEHSHPNHKDVVNPKCSSCGLFIVGKRGKLCSYCNPDTPLRERTKENTVKEFLQQAIDRPFVHDKTVEGASSTVCGKYRPDFVYDCGTHFIVVECDEEQHRDYDKGCELIRMKNILNALGLKTIFLRYSPDAYRVDGIVKRIGKEERLRVLSERVRYYMSNIHKNTMIVEWLYYNDKHLERKSYKIF